MALSKDDFSHLAAGPLARVIAEFRGMSVAMIGYTLAPQARIADITAEIAAAANAVAKLGSGPLRLAGHSAGGHLVAASTHDAAPPASRPWSATRRVDNWAHGGALDPRFRRPAGRTHPCCLRHSASTEQVVSVSGSFMIFKADRFAAWQRTRHGGWMMPRRQRKAYGHADAARGHRTRLYHRSGAGIAGRPANGPKNSSGRMREASCRWRPHDAWQVTGLDDLIILRASTCSGCLPGIIIFR